MSLTLIYTPTCQGGAKTLELLVDRLDFCHVADDHDLHGFLRSGSDIRGGERAVGMAQGSQFEGH